MWCVLAFENGELLHSEPAGLVGWQRCVRWATEQGGEVEIVFLEHVRPGRGIAQGDRSGW